jgi:hypothetical protein
MEPPRPLRVLEAHLDAPLAPVELAPGYGGARVLVRLHRRPLGVLELDRAVAPDALAKAARAALGPAIDAHLVADGLPPAPELPLGGLPARSEPCGDAVAIPGVEHVSVVIATRERPELLRACLRSLPAGEAEVLVVDNAPRSDATRRVAEEAGVRYLVEPRPGAALARNRGLAEARGDIVAFLDDDVVADADWLSATVGGFRALSGVGCVTSLILPLELETPAQLWLEEFGGFDKGFARRVFDLAEHRLPDPLYPWSAGIYGSGAAMAFDTALLREAGGFDPRLASGGEDLDLFLKVLFAGGRIVYEPAALVWHRHPRDYAALRRTMFTYGAGLSGLMTKWALSRPATAAQIARRLPAAARLALDPRSRKNAGKRPGYPRELTRRELTGLAAGPALFLSAAWSARRPG